MRRSAFFLMVVIPGLSMAAAAGGDAQLDCVIFPDEQVDLGAPVPGVIEHIGVRRSEQVRKGQAIATLESSVERATAALASARAGTATEVELRRVEFSYDAQHRDRLVALQAREAVSPQHLEDAERVAEAARLRVRLAQDKRREAMLDQRRADAMLARKTIVSPIDGVVIQLNNRVGEYVETRPVARIARLDPLRVEVIAPLALFGSVKEGMRVAVGPETEPDHERFAIVSAVDAVADPGSGTFGIQLELPNPDLELPAGIKCTARLLPPDQARTAMAPPATGGETRSSVIEQTDTAAGLCLAFDTDDSEARAQLVVEAARRSGGEAELKRIDAPRIFGYLVATSVAPDPESLMAMEAQLEAAGISDLYVMRSGEYAGRIALGTYNGPRSAERRRAALANLGVDAEVLPRTRAQQAWRVEVRLPETADSEGILATLRLAADDALMQAETCDLLRTAAR